MSTDRVGGSGIVRRHKATHATGGTDALTPADIGAVSNSLIADKGKIAAGNGSTAVALSVGANDTVLTADSATATGLAWKAASGPALAHYFPTGQGTVTKTVPTGYYWVETDATDTVVTVGAASVTGKGPNLLNVTTTGSSFGVSRPGLAGDLVATTWTTRTSNFGATSVYALTFGNGLFVAGGANATMTTSTDGATWTTRTSGFGATSLIWGAGYGNGLYLAGGQAGALSTSTDGITWTSRTSGFTDYIRAFAYGAGPGLHVMTGNGGRISTSTDGITWTSRTSNLSTNNVNAVTFGTIYVAGASAGTLSTSTDGITWTSRTLTGFTSANVEGLAYGHGIYVASGQAGGTDGRISTSTDGITWTSRTLPAMRAYPIAFGAGVFVVAGETGTMASSTDGITWTSRTSGFGATDINRLAFGLNRMVAAGNSGTMTSADATVTDQPTAVVATALTTVT